MDLLSLLRVINKHKFMITLGVLLGVVLSVNMVYRTSITLNSIGFKPKPLTKYQTSVSIILSDPKFELGRSVISGESGAYERIVSLTTTYAYMVTSDDVLKKLEKKFGPLEASIEATPVRGSSIININIEGLDAEYVVDMANQLPIVFSGVLNGMQDRNKIPNEDRIYIKTLSTAKEPSSSGSRAIEYAILGFLMPFIVMLGLAFVKENIDQKLNTEKIGRHVIGQIRETAS